MPYIEQLAKEGKIRGYKVIGKSEDKEKKNKYGNKKIVWEGVTFDSKKEFLRYQDLLLAQKMGIISELQRQVVFELIPKQKGQRACKYIADHVYWQDGVKIVEDVKSKATRKLSTYIMKKKLMQQVFNIKIKEV